MFKCEQCVKFFTRADILSKHVKIYNLMLFTCDICFITFTRKDILTRLKKNMHGMYFSIIFTSI